MCYMVSKQNLAENDCFDFCNYNSFQKKNRFNKFEQKSYYLLRSEDSTGILNVNNGSSKF